MGSSVHNRAFGDGEEVVVEVIEAVAAEEGVDPTGLEPPLYEVVDPDAVASLFRSANGDGYITFSYRGHDVVVYGDGRVTVAE